MWEIVIVGPIKKISMTREGENKEILKVLLKIDTANWAISLWSLSCVESAKQPALIKLYMVIALLLIDSNHIPDHWEKLLSYIESNSIHPSIYYIIEKFSEN